MIENLKIKINPINLHISLYNEAKLDYARMLKLETTLDILAAVGANNQSFNVRSGVADEFLLGGGGIPEPRTPSTCLKLPGQ